MNVSPGSPHVLSKKIMYGSSSAEGPFEGGESEHGDSNRTSPTSFSISRSRTAGLKRLETKGLTSATSVKRRWRLIPVTPHPIM
ncbi:MAG: hypothetical protein WBA71_03050 [Candidatus Humimicrobiia bacterium]